MKRPKKAVRLSDDDIAYLDGYLSAWDELPDGAWQAACEDAIGACEKFKGQDPYEVWLAWCRANSNGDVELCRTIELDAARLRAENKRLKEALEAIALALDVPRDRLGRLDGEHDSAEPLRKLAVRYKTPGAQDRMDQSMHVARAALKAKP
jgi:hypothetical protein